MKTIPMIFNQEMVKALVDGRKTVTRRPVKYSKDSAHWSLRISEKRVMQSLDGCEETPSGIGLTFEVGDLIWVRETFCFGRLDEVDAEHPLDREIYLEQTSVDINVIYKQNTTSIGACVKGAFWKPSIHMPRKASRLTLRVTDVRVERVQDITERSAVNEGFELELASSACSKFAKTWNSIYKNWNQNPWVWVIEFEVIHKNVDQVMTEVAA